MLTTKFKTTYLKFGIKKGTELPNTENEIDDGYIGKVIHKELSKVYNVNNGLGIDLPDEQVEVKTRDILSTADHTVTTMTVNNLLTTQYEGSPVQEKLLSQYRVKHNKELGTVVEERIYNFDKPEIQEKLSNDWIMIRRELVKQMSVLLDHEENPIVNQLPKDKYGNDKDILKEINLKDNWIVLERVSTNGYKVRLTNTAMKRMENIAVRDEKAFNENFSYD